MTRTAEQIGRTELGSRPLPPLAKQRAGRAPTQVDTVLDNGLRVVAVRRTGVPMVELRMRVPFAGTHRTHPARSEVLATTLLAGTVRRSRAEVEKRVLYVAGESAATFDLYGPEAREPGTFAANCLLARRLAERNVRFIQLYHPGWDHHGGLPGGIRRQCGDVDRACYARPRLGSTVRGCALDLGGGAARQGAVRS